MPGWMIPVIFFGSYGVCVFVFLPLHTPRLFRWICLCVTLHDSRIISQASGRSLVALPSCRLGNGWEGRINTEMATHAHGTQYYLQHSTATLHGMPKRNRPYPKHVKLWCYICCAKRVSYLGRDETGQGQGSGRLLTYLCWEDTSLPPVLPLLCCTNAYAL